MSDQLQKIFQEHEAVLRSFGKNLLPVIEKIAQTIRASLEQGGKILVFGNGGSAADSQHFAAEMVGRFVRDRRPLPAISLTTDTSALTSLSNDFGFEEIFERQVIALANKGDVVIGITTSGNSKNVVNALIAARDKQAVTIAFTGGDGGRAASEAAHSLIIPSAVTARIQEMHILAIHMICDLVDHWAAEDSDE